MWKHGDKYMVRGLENIVSVPLRGLDMWKHGDKYMVRGLENIVSVPLRGLDMWKLYGMVKVL